MVDKQLLIQYFENLFEDKLIEEMTSLGIIKSFKANEILIDLNDVITHMPLLLHGAIRIMREDANDCELVLFFLVLGDIFKV